MIEVRLLSAEKIAEDIFAGMTRELSRDGAKVEVRCGPDVPASPS